MLAPLDGSSVGANLSARFSLGAGRLLTIGRPGATFSGDDAECAEGMLTRSSHIEICAEIYIALGSNDILAAVAANVDVPDFVATIVRACERLYKSEAVERASSVLLVEPLAIEDTSAFADRRFRDDVIRYREAFTQSIRRGASKYGLRSASLEFPESCYGYTGPDKMHPNFKGVMCLTKAFEALITRPPL